MKLINGDNLLITLFIINLVSAAWLSHSCRQHEQLRMPFVVTGFIWPASDSSNIKKRHKRFAIFLLPLPDFQLFDCLRTSQKTVFFYFLLRSRRRFSWFTIEIAFCEIKSKVTCTSVNTKCEDSILFLNEMKEESFSIVLLFCGNGFGAEDGAKGVWFFMTRDLLDDFEMFINFDKLFYNFSLTHLIRWNTHRIFI